MTGTDMFSLAGRRAFVTGGSRGIGLALAAGLGRAGAEVIIAARDGTALASAADSLRAEQIKAGICVLDVSQHDRVRMAVDALETAGQPIDILVNNAGMQHRQPLHEFDIDMFDQLMATNLRSVFSVSQAVAGHMIKRGHGKIINIASVMSLLARPAVAPYTASKGAVSNLTKGMAADWAPLGLNCNAIAPGYFQTELNAALMADTDFNDWLINRTPARRWGRVDELVGACVFLAAPASDFVNGQTLFVDGGLTATV